MKKHESVLISTWRELSEVGPSKKHRLVIDELASNGWHITLDEDAQGYSPGGYSTYYLSTHSFYGNNFKETTKILQDCGFNVRINNADRIDTSAIKPIDGHTESKRKTIDDVEIKEGTHVVLKEEDLKLHLSETEQEIFALLYDKVIDGRKSLGKKENKYYVINHDEPYSNLILYMIKEQELKKL